MRLIGDYHRTTVATNGLELLRQQHTAQKSVNNSSTDTEGGTLLFLRSETMSSRKQSSTLYESLLSEIVGYAKRAPRSDLRLLVLDPINSVLGLTQEKVTQQRQLLQKVISDVKRAGANLILVAEEDTAMPIRFIENIADTRN